LAVGVKTITVTEEAYRLLAKEKKGEESFSQVIKRLTGERGRLADSLGAWKMSEKEAQEIFSSLRKHWKRTDARIRGRASTA
jgi:predicted CopG family antitoxin